LFDFSWGLLGDPDRQASQDRNYNSFKDFIINTVNQSILNPAGLVLQPGIVNGSAHIISRSLTTELIAANAITANEILANTITANEIAANAITANELAANLVLVNNIISSNNYVTGVSGWVINSNGTAEFANTSIRGTVEAGSLTTPGIDIDANGNLTANTFALYGNGAIVTSSGNFGVDASGNLYAENANITGEINATSGSVSGDLISGGTISGVDMILSESGIETSINVPFIFGGSAYTFIVKEIASPLNAVRIAPGKVIVTNPSHGISLDMTNGIFSTLPIQSTSTVEMETGQVNGLGILYPGCSPGIGTANHMGLVWNNPNIIGTVDNAVSAVLGTVSDVRSKSYILNAEDTWLNKIYDSLRVVSFNPVDLLDEENLHLYPRRLGLIAQELNEILPDLVVSANPYDEEAFLSVNYLGLVPYLIQAVQDLNNRVKELESKV
jgi:hypothetical protein